jgi:hypothetical protein
MKKVVGIPKILAKIPLKTQEFNKNARTGPAHRPGEKDGGASLGAVFRRKKAFF